MTDRYGTDGKSCTTTCGSVQPLMYNHFLTFSAFAPSLRNAAALGLERDLDEEFRTFALFETGVVQ